MMDDGLRELPAESHAKGCQRYEAIQAVGAASAAHATHVRQTHRFHQVLIKMGKMREAASQA